MPRSTLVIGNGLGRALDSNAFTLDVAMANVWENPDCLTEKQKRQLKRCVDVVGVDDRPHGEEHLDVMHLAVIACRFLNSIAAPNVDWLSADGKAFPSAIEKYITTVAWHFHHYTGSLPAPFIDSLALFLAKTQSHIATLNYDNLLYKDLIRLKILDDYDGALIDGFWVKNGKGFAAKHLDRLGDHNFGYYLHLHGSPLFFNNGDIPMKQKQFPAADESISTPHLVLAHIKHKKSIIANSYLLTSYWDYFERGLRESNRIVIFGYSGLDLHLNEVIAKYSNGRRIVVVERSKEGSDKIRKAFWNEKLKAIVELVQLGNILEFTEWETV